MTCAIGPRVMTLKPLAIAPYIDETALETENRKEVDKVALDEAQAGEVIQFVLGKDQAA